MKSPKESIYKHPSEIPTEIKCEYFDSPVFVYYADLDNIERLPDKPGWYCWIYVPITTDDFSPTVNRPVDLHVSLSGPMSLAYEGNAKPKDPEIDIPSEKYFNALRQSMLAFSPPLYIGMAKRLRSRLLTHSRYLKIPEEHLNLSINQLDTDVESKFFGYRIAEILQKNNVRRECLIVKCLTSYIKSKAGLKPIETILNRIYTPPQGRRA